MQCETKEFWLHVDSGCLIRKRRNKIAVRILKLQNEKNENFINEEYQITEIASGTKYSHYRGP